MCINLKRFKDVCADSAFNIRQSLRRKKIWELEHRFHCSIAGTCFTLDCISHDAVARIKRDCKRYGKHFTLLPKSSLSAFTKGVLEFSNTPAMAS